MRYRTVRRYAVLLVAATFVAAATSACARRAPDAASVAVAELPSEARATLANIRSGPPFPYERDGVAFGNRELLLPAKPRGYYREYTVRTPGERSRGARRIVCGGKPTSPEACWYTDDHYSSFRRIIE
jgi:ribonuclease T1